MSRSTMALLFSDIAGSTRLLQQLGPGYSDVLFEHRRVMRAAFAANGGEERGTEGDSFFVTFPTASDAVAAAFTATRDLATVDWPAGTTVRVRIGLHVGAVETVADSVIGLAVHEAARLAAAGHGGQILASEAAARLATALPAGATWRELGKCRFKDVLEPMTVLQLEHPDLESDHPPLRVQGGGRYNLPAQPSSFVGRAKEVAAVEQALATSRLVTVTGTGGVGKTRIALRVAASQGERFRDGVWFVDLTSSATAESVMSAVASSLGIGDPDDVLDRLADQEAFVLVDNCEHVIEHVADFISKLLQHCPSVTVMATSREPLGIPGEVVWRVPPMQPEEAIELLAVRARAVSTRFAMTEANRGAVLDVCRRLDAIPLALELAAARLGSLSVDQLASRLDSRFRLLSGGRGAMERHRTLQATVDWSYELLDESERAALRRMGVFAGGFDLDAAEAVCCPSDPGAVLDLVDQLVAKSLVVAEERPSGMRYRLLETLRQYAVDRLGQAGELQAARDAHLNWMAHVAGQAGRTLWYGGDEVTWLTRLDDEDANLRSAVEWALARERGGVGVWILFGVFGWLTARGRAQEGLELSRKLLFSGLEEPERALGQLLVLFFQSNAGPISPEAVEAVRDSADLLDQTPQPWLSTLARAYTIAWSYSPGDAAAAADRIDACRAMAQIARWHGPGIYAWCLQPLIWVNLDAGRLDDARAAADDGLAAAAAGGLSYRESRMALNRARIDLADGNLDDAWTFAERAAVTARGTGETFVATAATQLLADVAERRGDRLLARELLVSVLDSVVGTQPADATNALRERISSLA